LSFFVIAGFSWLLILQNRKSASIPVILPWWGISKKIGSWAAQERRKQQVFSFTCEYGSPTFPRVVHAHAALGGK
jgi:hypothetical protein